MTDKQGRVTVAKKGFLYDLRRAYPTIGVLKFVKIIEESRECDNLLEILDEAEREALEKKAREDQSMRELGLRLALSEQHTRLHFVVPADVDLEHAQAIVAYGFLMPGQSRVFAGRHVLPESNVCENVQHKLKCRYSEAKYAVALAYLKKEGVALVTSNKSRGSGDALSLNLDEKGRAVSHHGAQIIRVAKGYLRQK